MAVQRTASDDFAARVSALDARVRRNPFKDRLQSNQQRQTAASANGTQFEQDSPVHDSAPAELRDFPATANDDPFAFDVSDWISEQQFAVDIDQMQANMEALHAEHLATLDKTHALHLAQLEQQRQDALRKARGEPEGMGDYARAYGFNANTNNVQQRTQQRQAGRGGCTCNCREVVTRALNTNSNPNKSQAVAQAILDCSQLSSRCVLGICTGTVDVVDVKKQYYAIALQIHPDKQPSTSADMSVDFSAAFQTLSSAYASFQEGEDVVLHEMQEAFNDSNPTAAARRARALAELYDEVARMLFGFR